MEPTTQQRVNSHGDAKKLDLMAKKESKRGYLIVWRGETKKKGRE
jgi:hypothetical protein